MPRVLFLAVLVAAAVLTLVSRAGQAAYPGFPGSIAFERDLSGDEEVFVLSAFGGDPINVTNNPASDTFPAFSPDGTQIVFRSDRDGDQEIWLMNADGSGLQKLTSNFAADSAPAWSPDGTQIAFASERDGDFDVWVLNVDGTGATNLTNANPFFDGEPDWSPDGTSIIYTRWSSLATGYDVYVMDSDGSDPTPLAESDSEDIAATYSPDGQTIAFTTSRDGQREVYSMDEDGDDQTNLTNHPAADSYPEWSPAGDTTLFTSDRSGANQIISMNPDGSAPVALLAEPGADSLPAWQSLAVPPTPTPTPPPATPTPTPSPTPSPSPTPAGTLVLWGDSNCAAGVDPVDSLFLLRFDAGLSTDVIGCTPLGSEVKIVDPLASPCPLGAGIPCVWGDIDCSGAIDPVDALKLLRHDAGLFLSQEPDCPPVATEVRIVEA
jgi:Tol biopolymer transport system component